MSIEHNKATTRELFARFTEGNLDGIMDLLTEDATWLVPGNRDDFPTAGLYNKERIGRLFNAMLNQLPDGLKMTVTGMVAEGNKVAVEGESHGDLTNGRIYKQKYHFLMEFRDGKICAVREYLDTQHAHLVWFAAAEVRE
ncbi:MAG: nuclear transport factor 2 family protein [Chloroflexi bacterium]|nr:nuclear transport factor 2 family protein [Chloroflexota bacterium]